MKHRGILLLLALGPGFAPPLPAAATEELRILELRQEVRELQRQLRDQSRRIDRLERELRRRTTLPGLEGPDVAPGLGEGDPDSTAWIEPGLWGRVQPGMSAQEVIAILGAPTAMRAEEAGPATRTLFYTLPIGDTGFLSGRVVLREDRVLEVERPVLK